MDWENIFVVVVPVGITVMGNFITKRIDAKNELKKARESARAEEAKSDTDRFDSINEAYKNLYETQLSENASLKEEYKLLKKKLESLQGDVNGLNDKIHSLTNDFDKEKDGYLVTIGKLKEENKQLKETNEGLRKQLEELNHAIK